MKKKSNGNRFTALVMVWFLATVVWLNGGESVSATQACEAFNNMKHTKNSGDIRLTVGEKYNLIETKRGQHYITIQGASVPNRWVDEKCFTALEDSHKEPQTTPVEEEIVETTTKQSGNGSKMLLALSWQNAFCETHRYVKECKRRGINYTDTRFSLHGLWPQPIGNEYCGVSSQDKSNDKGHKWREITPPDLSAETYKELLPLMPGADSHLHHHEWIKHGTCSGMSGDGYFKKAIKLTKQINDSKLGEFFAQNIGRSVTLEQIRFKMNESFGAGSGRHVELRCQKGMIMEVWIHMGSQGDDVTSMLRGGDTPFSKCQKGSIDRVGFE